MSDRLNLALFRACLVMQRHFGKSLLLLHLREGLVKSWEARRQTWIPASLNQRTHRRFLPWLLMYSSIPISWSLLQEKSNSGKQLGAGGEQELKVLEPGSVPSWQSSAGGEVRPVVAVVVASLLSATCSLAVGPTLPPPCCPPPPPTPTKTFWPYTIPLGRNQHLFSLRMRS